jgi:glyoxylase-like metal-dependent hydrolase (beta-lactamase superfamily II)
MGPHEADRFLLDSLEDQARGMGTSARPITPDQWLAQGNTVAIGGQSFEILHCPGHTPGSVVLFCPAQRFALVGDVLFKGSIGRNGFPVWRSRVSCRRN